MLETKPQSASDAVGPKARFSTLPAEGVTIAEAARLTGVSVHTLRYYERAGLVISPVDRTSGGRRRYRELDLKWIVICTKLRATGMPIRGIREYAELVAAGPGNEAERLALLEAHRADVLAKLAEMQENLKLIDRKIDVYKGSLAAGDADRLWAPVMGTADRRRGAR
ncbi:MULTISPECIES: MerR family transcriptional regulator [Streptomyces]|uniref:MerR family transcriptional regulator n=1 Tax=Streptomyces TaxID=1883 RepID=UPI0006893899|nr:MULTISPECIES: MerR family transcriptional regulator [Streptomyces]ARP70764.1 MerR family transcriptional regulator [Streptomyces pluripotens]MCH0556535.1 MerR family transcriptional regulator [Streptomyces sp. MUM 16J]